MANRLTIIELKGDSDAIANQVAENQPVMEKAAKENGGIFHVRAKTPDGVIIVNLWESEEGSDAVFELPDVQEAVERLRGVVDAPPERNHYEVLGYKEV